MKSKHVEWEKIFANYIFNKMLISIIYTVVLEKTLESPLDCKEIQAVHLKGDQSWVFTLSEGLILKLKS